MNIRHKIITTCHFYIIFARSFSLTRNVSLLQEPSFQSVASARVLRNSLENYADGGGPSWRNKTAPNKVPAVQPSVFLRRCLRPDPRHEYPYREIITRLEVHYKSSTVVANAVASAIQHRITFIRPLNVDTWIQHLSL